MPPWVRTLGGSLSPYSTPATIELNASRRLNIAQWLAMLVHVAFRFENPNYLSGDADTPDTVPVEACVERTLIEKVVVISK